MTPKQRLTDLYRQREWCLSAMERAARVQSYQVGDGATARALQNTPLDEAKAALDLVEAQIAALEAHLNGRRRIFYFRTL